MKHITLEDVKKDLPGIITQKGKDYVYRSPDNYGNCFNVYHGEGSCLIGRYLLFLGIPMEFLEERANHSLRRLVNYLNEFLTMDENALDALADIQHDQDNNVSWGDAYEKIFGKTHETL